MRKHIFIIYISSLISLQSCVTSSFMQAPTQPAAFIDSEKVNVCFTPGLRYNSLSVSAKLNKKFYLSAREIRPFVLYLASNSFQNQMIGNPFEVSVSAIYKTRINDDFNFYLSLSGGSGKTFQGFQYDHSIFGNRNPKK